MADALYVFSLLITAAFLAIVLVRSALPMPDPHEMTDVQTHKAAMTVAVGLFCGGGWIFATWWTS